eukprot:3358338-Prymnesium_polylepis.1
MPSSGAGCHRNCGIRPAVQCMHGRAGQLVEPALYRARGHDVGVLQRLGHDLFEGGVDAVEAFGLLGQLSNGE